jgi:hypothetical protein
VSKIRAKSLFTPTSRLRPNRNAVEWFFNRAQLRTLWTFGRYPTIRRAFIDASHLCCKPLRAQLVTTHEFLNDSQDANHVPHGHVDDEAVSEMPTPDFHRRFDEPHDRLRASSRTSATRNAADLLSAERSMEKAFICALI